jgi:hypothetical protein
MITGAVRLPASYIALQAGERRVWNVGTGYYFINHNNFMLIMWVDELMNLFIYIFKMYYLMTVLDLDETCSDLKCCKTVVVSFVFLAALKVPTI